MLNSLDFKSQNDVIVEYQKQAFETLFSCSRQSSGALLSYMQYQSYHID